MPLQRIINAFIRENKYPSAFENVIGIPVFKKGSRQDNSCYRMVQNSEACATAFESLINKQLVQYLLSNDLIPQNQYAIAGRGTISCLRDVYSHWIDSIDISKHSVVASFDLKSAFWLINVIILYKKLVLLGASPGTVEWF